MKKLEPRRRKQKRWKNFAFVLNVCKFEYAECVLYEIYIFLPVGLEQGPQICEKILCNQEAEAQRGCGAATDGRKQGDDDVIGP